VLGGVAQAAQDGHYATKADEKARKLTPGRPAVPRGEAPTAGGETCGTATVISALPFNDSDDTTGNVGDALARLKTQAEATQGDARRAVIERAIRLARSHGDLEAVAQLEAELIALAPAGRGLRWRREATLAQLGRDDDRP